MCYPWKREKKIKHFKPLKEDECAICLGAIINEASQCQACGKVMHRMCLNRWKYTCNKQENNFTCPLCRFIFTKYN